LAKTKSSHQGYLTLNLPNLITGMRIVLTLIAIFLLLSRNNIAAGLVITLAWVTDFLDGYLARRLKQATEAGGVLDLVADRLLMMSVLIITLFQGFWMRTAGLIPLNPFPYAVVVLAAARPTLSGPFHFLRTDGNTGDRSIKVRSGLAAGWADVPYLDLYPDLGLSISENRRLYIYQVISARPKLEIVPGIHRIDSVIGVNCYLLKTEQGWLLVDTGLPGQENKVLDYLKKQRIPPSAIAFIILTHADLDHIGCAKALRAATGAKIAIHPGDVPVLIGKQAFKTINNFFKHAVNLAFSFFPYPAVEPDVLLDDGAILGEWQILHTPGHTPGSVCLFLPGRCLLVGDALRTSWQANPRPISKRICVDLAQARQSLIKIGKLDYEILLPGHGAPITNKASLIIREMVTRATAKALNTKKIMGFY